MLVTWISSFGTYKRFKTLVGSKMKNKLLYPITLLIEMLLILYDSNHVCSLCYVFTEGSSPYQLSWFNLYIIFHYSCDPTSLSFIQLSLDNIISYIYVDGIYKGFVVGHIMLKLFKPFHYGKHLFFNKWVPSLVLVQCLAMKSNRMFFLLVILLWLDSNNTFLCSICVHDKIFWKIKVFQNRSFCYGLFNFLKSLFFFFWIREYHIFL